MLVGLTTLLVAVIAFDLYRGMTGDKNLLYFALGSGVPIILLLGVGVSIYWMSEQPDLSVNPVLQWTVVGILVMGLGTGWLLGLRALGTPATPGNLLLDATAIGAAIGTFVGYNVSKLKVSRKAVETERRRRAALFQNSLSAIADLEFEGGDPVIREANEEFRELFAFKSANVAGERLFDLTAPDDDEAARKMAAHLRREEVYTSEVTRPTSEGTKHFRLRLVPYSVREEIQRAYVSYIDITPFKEAERLERSNERLQEFAYIAAHDLQEPLRMVSSYVDLLAAEYEDRLDEEATEYIDFAVSGAERMQEMINALLTYSRVETEGEAFEETDAEAVVENVLTDLELLIEDADASVHVESLPTVTADGNQLSQLFQNLVRNAIQHADEQEPTVRIESTDVGGAKRFAVADNGPGIPEEKQDEVFRIFEGGSDSGGTGMGLAICRRIVERHGGDIWVESGRGDGTTVYFTIPTETGRQSTTREIKQ